MANSKTVEMTLSASDAKNLTKAQLVERVNMLADLCTMANESAFTAETQAEKFESAYKKALRDAENTAIKLASRETQLARIKARAGESVDEPVDEPVKVTAKKAKSTKKSAPKTDDSAAVKFWTPARVKAWAEELAGNKGAYKGKSVPGPMWSIAFQWARNGKVSDAQSEFFTSMCVKNTAKIKKLYSVPSKKAKTA